MRWMTSIAGYTYIAPFITLRIPLSLCISANPASDRLIMTLLYLAIEVELYGTVLTCDFFHPLSFFVLVDKRGLSSNLDH